MAYRSSLFVLGLLYISLTWGLILIKQDDGVSWLGVHMILILGALAALVSPAGSYVLDAVLGAGSADGVGSTATLFGLDR